MKRFEEYTKVRYEIVLTNMVVRGGEWATEEAAMKAVSTMEEIFHGKFVKLQRHEIPTYRWVEC